MPIAGRAAVGVVLCCSAIAAACSAGVLKPQYEYEEELYIDLDGSATLNLNASVAALVALRGADLPTDPRARLDRDRVRALFARPGTTVALTLSRRDRRRFVHASIDVDDVRELAQIQPFSWSTYAFDRDAERAEFRQIVGPASRRDVGPVGWDGSEMVVFRMHVPSEILFDNSVSDVGRGNILEWEQPLLARLRGDPLELRVQMSAESILHNTLVLFASTIVAAAAAFAAVLWWAVRRGREPQTVESRA